MAAASLTNLTLQMFRGPTWSAFFNALQLQGSSIGILGAGALRSAVGPTAAYGIDSLFYVQKTIAASGTYTVDFSSYQDVAGNLAVSAARVKAYWVALLDSSWDATITAPASGITFGAGGVANAHQLNLANASDLISLEDGEQCDWWTPGAAGRVIDATHKIVTTTNLDATNAAVVRMLFGLSLS